ncbi:plasmid replication protein [Vibrio phage 1.115.B._10N.222.49.B11]|nr:plasmid replication protein [Vibrio phage 1.115.A._10N.222.49.B11]AUR88596.1 plasmid replication protein [Vibrio phage 1.115.B._10N.222.49.B11]AUR90639.1 plasmid replication protein [Vibrio phage 1.148.O._10N.286.54.A10]
MAKEIYDKETGEVFVEPDFIKLYIKEMCTVKGMTSAQAKMFNFMLMNMNWDNTVCYGARTKEKFMKDNEMKNQTYNNNVSALIKAGLIERIGRGEFRVNKKYAVKVEWSKVQAIEWTTKYTKDGKIEKVKFS